MRLLLRSLIALALFAPAEQVFAGSPAAASDGSGCITNEEVCGDVDMPGGSPGLAPTPGPSSGPRRTGVRKPSYLRWHWEPTTSGAWCVAQVGQENDPASYVIWDDAFTNPGPGEWGDVGDLVAATLVDTRDGSIVRQGDWICRPDPAVAPAAPQPSLPPPVPEPEEVVAFAPIPKVAFEVSPGVKGLTGLETLMWAQPGVQTTVTVTTPEIRGYSVTTTANLVSYAWEMGDGQIFTSSGPGTPENPAVRHRYERKGDYTITLSVVWEGSYVFTGPGIANPVTVDLGAVTNTSSVSYPVIEVRSVLDGPSE